MKIVAIEYYDDVGCLNRFSIQTCHKETSIEACYEEDEDYMRKVYDKKKVLVKLIEKLLCGLQAELESLLVK